MCETVSYARDISPVLEPYCSQMIWRFNLADYEDVKRNSSIILARMQGNGGIMPPPPFQPLEESFIQTFERWMQQDFPP